MTILAYFLAAALGFGVVAGVGINQSNDKECFDKCKPVEWHRIDGKCWCFNGEVEGVENASN